MTSRCHRSHKTLAILTAIGTCLVLTSPTWAQRREREKTSEFLRTDPKVMAAFRDVVTKPGQSVVRITCDGKDAALGTIVGSDGWIITKASELKGKLLCKARDGREWEAEIVGVHPQFDVAMLKVDAKGLTAVQWEESKAAPVGNWVASVGLGTTPAAIGVVSVASRTVPVRSVNANTNPGFLGISLDPNEDHAKVAQVTPGSGAAKAGVKVDDTILSVAGKAVKDPDELLAILGGTKPGDTVDLKIKRGTQEMELKATLGKRPPNSSRGDFQNNLGSALSTRRTDFPTFLQHDTVLKPADCGGPIVDLDGKVIGINIARAGRTESYAIPSEAVGPMLFDLISGKLAPLPAPAAVVTSRTVAEKLAEAKAALDKATSDLEKLMAEKAAAEKRLALAKDSFAKAEEDARPEKLPAPKVETVPVKRD